MDTIYDVLSKEHVQVLYLFKETMNNDSKENFFKIKKELDPHLEGEEKVFYPVLKEKEEVREVTLEGIQEHHVAKVLLSELENMDQKDEMWHAKLKVLKEAIEHHVKEEEDNMFEKAQKVLSQDKAEEIAQKYLDFKKDFKEQKGSKP